jgi:hypothetical protein
MGHTVCDSKLTSAGLLAEGAGARVGFALRVFIFIYCAGLQIRSRQKPAPSQVSAGK